MAKNVNPYDPGSTIRNPEKIERRCICGVLAELAVKELLKQHISNHNIDAKVFQSITTTNGSDAGDQIDIPIEVHGVQKNIEVRSSFPYSPLNTVITRLFDIIGWYKSEHKSMEHKKDYYLRVLYNFREEDTMQHINLEIDLHFVGGATRKMLEESGEWNDFKQWGASYRSIKPICAGLDAIEIMNVIFPKK